MQRRELLIAMAATGAGALLPTVGLSGTKNSRIVVDGLDTSLLNAEFIALLKQGGVDCVHKTSGPLDGYGALYRFLYEHYDDVMFAKSVADIHAAKAEGKISLTTGAQHANFLEAMLQKDTKGTYAPLVSALRDYYDAGLRIQGICYNVASIFGGGCLDHSVPLTRAGRRLVEEVHKLNILLDVGGHTGEQTSLDAIAVSSDVPIVCSHTNMAALNANPRAISDRLAVAIAKTGGVIGITAISDYHMRNESNAKAHGPRSPQASMETHLDQYDYLKRLVGVDHIGLGPDFVWGWGDTFDQDSEHSLTFPPGLLSDGPPIMLVKDYENISKLPNVENGLRQRGWKQSELDQLLGGNWLRVYQQAWGA